MVRIRSSTLIETVIALTLMVFMFGLATSIFVRLTNSNLSTSTLKAERALENFRMDTHNKLEYFNEEVVEDGFTIKRLIEEKSTDSSLIKIKFLVFDQRQHLLCEVREFKLKPSVHEKD